MFMKILSKIKGMSLEQSIKLFLLIVAFLGVYFIVAQPIVDERQIKKCKEKVQTDSLETWKEYCHIRDAEIGTDGSCLLPKSTAEALKSDTRKGLDLCVEIYK